MDETQDDTPPIPEAVEAEAAQITQTFALAWAEREAQKKAMNGDI